MHKLLLLILLLLLVLLGYEFWAHFQASSSSNNSSDSESSSSSPLALRVARLSAKGNIMDASAEAASGSRDPTTVLEPTVVGSSAVLLVDSASSTSALPSRTSPTEEMTEIPDYVSRAAEDVSRAVRMEMEDGDLVS